jgi:predicted short-subunit dehydrogenase-like oxidoreductase (DUF2520 family)
MGRKNRGMKKTKSLNICVIGAGRLGTTVSCMLAKEDNPALIFRALASRSDASLDRAKEIMGSEARGIVFTKDIKKAAALSDCILICTPDDAIGLVCTEIFSEKDMDFNGCYAIHFSGSKPLSVLGTAKSAGAKVASVHPLKSFASIKEAIKTLPGTVYGITYCSEESKGTALLMVKSLGGMAIEVDDRKKALYHAAACAASNYLVTLINYAVLIHRKIGIKPEDSLKGLMGLVEGTVSNIKKMGTQKSLTGPIARGDLGTIREHMKDFNKYFNRENISLYKIMGRETARIAHGNGWIDKETVDELEKILRD